MSWALAASAITLGLVSAPHCAAMCGGIAVASQVAGDSTARRRLPLAPSRAARSVIVAAQNGGRLASYAIAGAIAGGAGEVVGKAALGGARDLLQIAAAIAVLVAGATLAGVVPARTSLERLGLPLWRRLQPMGKRLLPIDTWRSAVLFGMIWGFLPCGLVYSALSLAALSGSVFGGVTTMLAFGLGTAPALAVMGTAAGTIGGLVRRPGMRKGAGALVALFGVVQIAFAVQTIHAHASHHACCDAHVAAFSAPTERPSR